MHTNTKDIKAGGKQKREPSQLGGDSSYDINSKVSVLVPSKYGIVQVSARKLVVNLVFYWWGKEGRKKEIYH